MKAIFEFNLPEDQEEFEIFNKSEAYASAMTEISEKIFRPYRKHGYNNPYLDKLVNTTEGKEILEHLETMFYQILQDYDLKIY